MPLEKINIFSPFEVQELKGEKVVNDLFPFFFKYIIINNKNHKRMYGDDFTMEIGYEEKYDILGILVPENYYQVDKTVEIMEGFLIDVDKNGQIVQIEIHNVSEKINRDKKYIKSANIDVYVEDYEFSYLIVVDFNNNDCKIEQQILK